MLRLLLRLTSCASLILFSFLQTFSQWQTIGPVTGWKAREDGLDLTAGAAAVRIRAVDPGIIRVRCSPSGEFTPDSSWAVLPSNRTAPCTVRDSGTALVLSTSELTLRVRKNPCRLSFFDAQGHLLNQDDSIRGISWGGTEIVDWKTMPPDEWYYGLGEKSNALEKRGSALSMWNSDIPAYSADTDPLYQDIPFFYAIRNGIASGLFFDNTWFASFNMGKEYPRVYSFGAAGGELNYYILAGPTPREVLRHFTTLIGTMPLPPRWALGYQQCRWSYYPEQRVREIASTFRKKQIPCDVIYLDIHYMNGYRCFTWDSTRFPHPGTMINDLARDGFKTVVIIDPGIKIDSAYSVYQSGLEGNHYVKFPDGRLFTGDVWPGRCVFPDFTDRSTRAWWGSLYKGYMSDGIRGFWNDMNEPSVFNGPDKTMDLSVIHNDNGLKTDHRKNHNVYGMQMARATREGMLRLRPEERPFVLTRANYAGGQRYSAAWTGDNISSWEHLRIALPMCLNLSISGQPFVGTDIGGFIGMPSGELYARWLQFGVFTPLMRSHAEINSPNKEPWEYGSEFEAINRKTIRLRYQLLPFLYSAFREASVTGIAMMRPLVFDYPSDRETAHLEDEFLFGDNILVAPVIFPDTRKRDVYFPDGSWYDFWTNEHHEGRCTATVDAPIDRLPFFVKAGAILPTQNPGEYTEQQRTSDVHLAVYPGNDTARGMLYEDDGISNTYQQGEFLLRSFTYRASEAGADVQVTPEEGRYRPPERDLIVEVVDVGRVPDKVHVGKGTLERVSSVEKKGVHGWSYDGSRRSLTIRTPDSPGTFDLRIDFRGDQERGK